MGSQDKQKRKHKKDKGERQEESNQLNEKQQEEIDPQETEIEQDLPRKKKRKNKNSKGERQEESDQLNEEQRETNPQEAEIEQDLPRKQKRKHKNREERHEDSEQLNEEQKVAEVEQDLPHQQLVDDDSDAEDKPKRKKKKKPIVPVDNDNTGPKKGQKSIRQMKREKFAQRQADAQAVVKDQHKSDCLNYLSQWKHNRQNWKFMKVKQIWLCKNKFSLSLMPDALWPTLLEYFDSTQGNIRKILVEDANKIIKQLDDWTESQSKENNDAEAEESEVTKPDESVYKRARDLIQRLE